MIIDEWKGMYPSVWKGIITPESFSHPAKFSSRLIERIYQHGIECGWLHEGSRIIDPFGGVGLGAWPALRFGMDWTGCELEPRFVTLAQANIDAWNAKYSGRLARWGTARIIQGDSRHLAQVIGAAEACISSPPFSGVVATQDPNFLTPGEQGKINPSKSNMPSYGTTPGQLASLPPGALEAAISSPPFEDQDQYTGDRMSINLSNGTGATLGKSSIGLYGITQGNIGNDSGDTFWSAAREIVAQVYQVLAPGAVAVWVLKSYVKNKQLVDFPHQWQTLCESVGFVTLHEHHALLVRHGATSIDIDGNHHEHKTESKSFFRRLAEKNGSPRIDFETVLCMVKPGGAGGGWDGAISSPPYAEALNGNSNQFERDRKHTLEIGRDPDSPGAGYPRFYGTTPGQLGSLPPGSLDDATRHGGGG